MNTVRIAQKLRGGLPNRCCDSIGINLKMELQSVGIESAAGKTIAV